MKKILFLLTLLFIFSLVTFSQNPEKTLSPQTRTKITILSEDNICAIPGLSAEHGLCVLIEKDGRQYLYDTGRAGICIDNARVLGKDLTKTEKIFLSHGHVDHSGGLEKVLKAIGHPVEVIAHPEVFGKKYALMSTGEKLYIGIPFGKGHFEDIYKVSFNFQRGFYKVTEGLWLTGEVPIGAQTRETISKRTKIEVNGILQPDTLPDDDALVIETAKGLVVITGCGHRCIVDILEYVKKTLNKNIYAVIGGTHLEWVSRKYFQFVENELLRIFKENRTKLFAPNHCTGKQAISEFRVDFKDILKDASCGATFEF